MEKIKYLLIVLLSTLINISFSQFTVTPSTDAMALASVLGGPTITIDTAWLVCDNDASGFFSNAPAGLGVTDGIILSTGEILDIPSGAGTQASTSFVSGGDDDLDDLLTALGETYPTYDACVLELDFTTTGDTFSFNYVMGSEEYDEWVCGSVNDIFGFFITGSNPLGGTYNAENIAIIPGTSIPVSINSINNGVGTFGNATQASCVPSTYSAYYNGSVGGVVFDGNTVALTASALTTPCTSYHFKYAISDGGDGSYDSGVFIEAGSFSSNQVEVRAYSMAEPDFSQADEECVGGYFELETDSAFSIDYYVHFDIAGTAINGTDYDFLIDSVLMPAGDTVVTIPITIVDDNITEVAETIILTPYTSCGTLGNPDTLEILDFHPHLGTSSSSTLCTPAVVTLTGSGAQIYSWSDSSLVEYPDSSTTATINPVTETTIFYLDGILGICTFTDTVTVEVSQTVIDFVIEDISCAGADDGVYYMVPNDSASFPIDYTFPFIPYNDSVKSDFAPGLQFAQATDALGCVFSDFYTFVDPAGMVFTYDSVSISCAGANDGQLCVDLPDGTYSMNVDTNGVLMDTFNFMVNSNTFCFGSLAPGVYDVYFENDTTGCSDSFTASLSEPDGMSFGYDSTNISCAGASDGKICIFDVLDGSYTANVVYNGLPLPTYNFTINSDTFCMETLPDGYYEINLVNDATLCNANFTVNLTQPDSLGVSLNSVGTSLCAGGTIDSLVAVVEGGTAAYQYLWNNAETTPYLLSPTPGTYSVVVTDLNGCSDSASVTLVNPEPMYLNIEMDSALCAGEASGTAYLDSVSGGTAPYTYSWNTTPVQTNDTAFNVLAGQIILTVFDFNNCPVLDTIDVLEPANPLSISLSSNLISCFGGDTCIDATVSGGTAPYTFLWSDNQTTEDVCGLVAGEYILTVTDAKGCSKQDTITILEVAEIVLTKDSTNVNCFGETDGTATVNATGGSGSYTYLWDDASAQTTATATALLPGTYTVIVADVNDANCTKSISVNVTQPASALSVSLDNVVDVLCFGESTGEINVSVSGGTTPYSYSWSNSTSVEDLSNAPAGFYTLTVEDENNCSATYIDTIVEPLDIVITVDDSTNISCFGGSNGAIDISVTGGSGTYTYTWNGGATTQDVSGLAAGTHQVTVSDGNCTKTRIVQLTQPADVVISFNYSDYNGVNVSCNGSSNGTVEAVVVTGGSAPFSYTWDNGMTGNPITGIAANMAITVTVDDDNGCSYSQAIVSLNEPVILSLAKDSSNISCAGYNDGTATITPSGGVAPYTYLWSNGMTDASISGLAPNTYVCNVTDANDCQETIQVLITEAAAIIVTTSADSVKCWGDADGSVIVEASGGNGNAFEYSIDGGLTFQESAIFRELTAGVYAEIVVKQVGPSNCVSTPVSQIVGQPDPMFISITPEDTTIQIQESVPFNINVDPATGYYSGGVYSISDITSVAWSPIEGLSCTDCLDPIALTYEQNNEYVATVTYSPYGCVTSASATIQVENNLLYFIPEGFSPQGDGINDQFLVYGEALKDFSLVIFNRWGEKVFESSVQSLGWDGTYKGVLQNPGVFTYHFNATYLDDKEITKKGSFTLIR